MYTNLSTACGKVSLTEIFSKWWWRKSMDIRHRAKLAVIVPYCGAVSIGSASAEIQSVLKVKSPTAGCPVTIGG